MRESATAPIWGLLSGRDFDPDGWRRLEERAASNGLGRTEHARTMGRPTKLTAELSAKFCELVADGWFISHAAAEVGVTERCIELWRAAGEKDDADELHAAFFRDSERARAVAERRVLARIEDKSEAISRDMNPADWKADQGRLQIMNPKRDRETKRTELTGADGGAVQVTGLAELLAKGFDDGDGGGDPGNSP